MHTLTLHLSSSEANADLGDTVLSALSFNLALQRKRSHNIPLYAEDRLKAQYEPAGRYITGMFQLEHAARIRVFTPITAAEASELWETIKTRFFYEGVSVTCAWAEWGEYEGCILKLKENATCGS